MSQIFNFATKWITGGLFEIITTAIYVAVTMVISIVLAFIITKALKRIFQKVILPQQAEKILINGVKYAIIGFGAVISLMLVLDNLTAFNTVLLGSFIRITVGACIAIVAGILLVFYAEKRLKEFLKNSTIDPILHRFIIMSFRVVCLVLLGIIVLEMLQVPTTALVASASAIGLAVSLAVKDNIANLTSGLIIIVTKPFSSGDFIESDGINGRVHSIEMAYTTLFTYDNKKILVPNNIMAQAKIINHSAETLRRLDIVFGIGYNDDYYLAKDIIMNVAKKFPKIVEDSEHKIYVGMCEHGDSSIKIVSRVWVDWADYYDLNLHMLENVKLEFDKNGINIPYNQLDVHVYNKILENKA